MDRTTSYNVWLSRCSSVLSILGSSSIIYIILSSYRRKIAKPKNRFMLMMSVFDVLQSMAILVSTAAMPRGMGLYGAMGNEATCTAQSILMGFGLAVPLYNSSLNLFYLLTIRYNMTTTRFSNKLEPLLHAFSVLVPLSSAATFAALGYANPSITTCLFPGKVVPRVAFTGVVIISFLFCVFSMGSICWSVLRQANRISRHRYGTTQTNRGAILEKEDMVKQALSYSLAFLLTFLFPTIQTVILIGRPGVSSPVLDALSATFYPLQGFYNFVFYVRPGVNHVMEVDPSKSLLRAIKDVILNAEAVSNSFMNRRSTNRIRTPRTQTSSAKSHKETVRNSSHTIAKNAGEADTGDVTNDVEKNCLKYDRPTQTGYSIGCGAKPVQKVYHNPSYALEDSVDLEMIYSQPQNVTQTAPKHNEAVSDTMPLPTLVLEDAEEGTSLSKPELELLGTVSSPREANDKNKYRKVGVSNTRSLPIPPLLEDYEGPNLESASRLQASICNMNKHCNEDKRKEPPSKAGRRRSSIISFASVLSGRSLDSSDNDMSSEPSLPKIICNMNDYFNERKENAHNIANKSVSRDGMRRTSLVSFASILSGVSLDSFNNDMTGVS